MLSTHLTVHNLFICVATAVYKCFFLLPGLLWLSQCLGDVAKQWAMGFYPWGIGGWEISLWSCCQAWSPVFRHHIASTDWSVSHGFPFPSLLGTRVLEIALCRRSQKHLRIWEVSIQDEDGLQKRQTWSCSSQCLSLAVWPHKLHVSELTGHGSTALLWGLGAVAQHYNSTDWWWWWFIGLGHLF